MNITIDARCFDGTKNGYSTYTDWLVGVLAGDGYDITLISNKPIKPDNYKNLSGIKSIKIGSKKDFIWEQFNLPRYLYDQKPDTYFCGQNIGLPLLYFGRTKLILGVLDMIPQRFLDHYIKTWKEKWHFLYLQRLNIIKSNKVLTISDSSVADIKQFMKGKNITRVYIRMQRSESTAKSHSASGKYSFLYIGGNEWRKRVANMCEAFVKFLADHPTAELRLVGDGYDDIIDQLKAKPNLKKQIKILGRLSDEDLARELRATTAVVFPSIFEGYGLPIAEALMMGKPVVCGRGGSQEEIGGNAAIYIDPDGVNSIYKGLSNVIKPQFYNNFMDHLKERQYFLSDRRHDQDLLEVFKK